MKIKSNKISDIRQFYLTGLSEIYSPQESAVIMDMIFKDIVGISRIDRVLNPEKSLSESEILKIQFAVDELEKHKPIQYILKNTWFYGLPFFVDENVLIPRPETEELVEWILHELDNIEGVSEILDIGTGSGCIAVSLKKHAPASIVWAVDISPQALVVAEKNTQSNGAAIQFLLYDILNNQGIENLPDFDVIVSNPPYVRNSEKVLMQKNVLEYEPALALFVEDDDPLKFYRAIADFAKIRLKPGGLLFLEINESLAAETAALLENRGFSEVIIRKDLNDKNRMIKVEKK